MGRSYGIIAFVEESSGKSLHPLLNHGTIGIDICSDLEIVELLASSDDCVKHSCADAPAKVPRDVENGRAVPSIFGCNIDVANAESGTMADLTLERCLKP